MHPSPYEETPEVAGHALLPRHMNLRILIVEDDAMFISVLNQKLSTIFREFPDAEVTMVRTLWRALEIAKRTPAPDIIFLDLTLLDATAKETVTKLHDLQDRSSVIIVTAHTMDDVTEMLRGEQVEILIKDEATWKGAKIIEAMLRSLRLRNEPTTSDVYQLLEKARQRIDAATPTPV